MFNESVKFGLPVKLFIIGHSALMLRFTVAILGRPASTDHVSYDKSVSISYAE